MHNRDCENEVKDDNADSRIIVSGLRDLAAEEESGEVSPECPVDDKATI